MKKIIGVLVLLALPLCANATIVDFYTDGTIESGNTYDQANIWNTAFVNMTGGSANIVEAHNSSTLQFQRRK